MFSIHVTDTPLDPPYGDGWSISCRQPPSVRELCPWTSRLIVLFVLPLYRLAPGGREIFLGCTHSHLLLVYVPELMQNLLRLGTVELLSGHGRQNGRLFAFRCFRQPRLTLPRLRCDLGRGEDLHLQLLQSVPHELIHDRPWAIFLRRRPHRRCFSRPGDHPGGRRGESFSYRLVVDVHRSGLPRGSLWCKSSHPSRRRPHCSPRFPRSRKQLARGGGFEERSFCRGERLRLHGVRIRG